MFSLNFVMKLSKNTNINKYTIKPIKDKQPFCDSIYTIFLMELEILKAYTKTY